jgi:hypothetical protein
VINLTFELNNQPMSALKIGTRSYPAFSGLGSFVNKRATMCVSGFGAIPIGTYYIFDRQSGGLPGPLKDIFRDHSDWFSLYAINGEIDDETYCKQVKRGNFRIHPKGPAGISQGCITLENRSDFQRLRAMLKGSTTITVPGIALQAYGKVVVK